MKTNVKISEVLDRGVEKIYPSRDALERVLMSGKKIRLYAGIDPTGRLHIGQLAILRKLRQFQDLGHEVIVLIGDFTATIGDPTGKLSTRKQLTRKQVLATADSYKKQIGKILDLDRANVRFLRNGEWFNKLKPADLLGIFSHFTVARLLERDMFQKRIQEGKDVLLHEFVYPVFQAYDSVAMDVDLEIGGNDQTFNMMRGRDLMGKMRKKEKFVMTLKLLTDPTGKKMGKTEGNTINLDEEPEQMFGKVMSWPDSLISLGFELLTDFSFPKESPRAAKARLAQEIIKIFYGQKAAESAEKEFIKVFKEGGLPSEILEVNIKEKTFNILDLLVKTKLAPSKAAAKRLIIQRGVKIDGQVQDDWQKIVEIKSGKILQVGKRKFAKIK